MSYELPQGLAVEADGPIRIVRLNRPDHLNATNHSLHRALADVFPQIDADADARVAVITGTGRAFSAGGDFDYLDQLTKDPDLRRQSLDDGRRIVTGMVSCRVPIVAAVNGPAVGSAAASSRSPTSSTSRRAPTSRTPTCWSDWWLQTAGR
jgi:enoyl-CoA hydratase